MKIGKQKNNNKDFILTGIDDVISLMKINMFAEDSNYDIISIQNGIDLLFVINTYSKTNKNFKFIVVNPSLPRLDLIKLFNLLNSNKFKIPVIIISNSKIDLSKYNYPNIKLISNQNILKHLSNIVETKDTQTKRNMR